MKFIKIIFAAIIIIIGVGFSILNAQTVKMQYFLGIVEWPLSLLLFVALTVGVLIGLFLGMLRHFALKRELWRTKRQLQHVAPEMVALPKKNQLQK